MRRAFCDAIMRESENPDLVFLTGDLGFGALEPLRDRLGSRFLNAGIAEQNMVSVAAGLAKMGMRPWTYSIAPFIVARPFEQIRNDVCMHQLPVILVGNGGGYGYGVMGGTHHALEDYGILLTLHSLNVYIPAFDNDLTTLIPNLMKTSRPSYLRLGLGEQPREWIPQPFAPLRKLISGDNGTVIAVGPLAGLYWGRFAALSHTDRPNLWCVSQLPLEEFPGDLIRDLQGKSSLIVAEEHVAQGSFGQALALQLLKSGLIPSRYVHRTAQGYPSGMYGSQAFHRRESGLDCESLCEALQLPVNS